MNLIREFSILAVLIGLLVFPGCSGSQGPECFPVAGRVSYRGKPVAEAMIVLHRIGGDVEGGQKPLAYTGADGTFNLTTTNHNDGAPLGEYVITVELRALKTVGEETVRSGPNLLPAKYAQSESSGLKYTIVPGENEIPPIDLK